MSVTKLNAQSFDQEVLHSDKPVLVDFYADWCGPCKMLSPVVDEIAGESDAYRVCKINVDDAPEIAARYEQRYQQFAKFYPTLKGLYPQLL